MMRLATFAIVALLLTVAIPSPSTATDLKTGIYEVVGKNTNGTSYEGAVRISQNDGETHYRVQWARESGVSVIGSGILLQQESVFVVSYAPIRAVLPNGSYLFGAPGIIVLKIADGGNELAGVWTGLYERDIKTERWIRVREPTY